MGGVKRRGAVVCGAYGMDNAGDDAVLAAIIAALREDDDTLPVTVMARRPRETAARFGVAAAHPLELPRWLSAMRRARVFISGGGSLLQDVTSVRSLLYYLAAIRLARACGCAVMLYGCGIGPLARPMSRRLAARAVNRCAAAVTVRDEGSRELLRGLGVTVPITLAADPAFGLPPRPGHEQGAYLGVAVRPWPGLDERLAAMAACVRTLCGEHRLTPVLFRLAPGDGGAAAALARALGDMPYETTDDPARIGEMRLMLSMRLHGLIFALRGGVPAVGVSYDPKVAALCREAGLPCAPLENADADTLIRAASAAMRLDPSAPAASAAALREREGRNRLVLRALDART